MKRLLLPVFLIGFSNSVVYAGKWDTVARGVNVALHHPDEVFSLVGFLIDLVLMCIPVAIVAGIVSLIIKDVFNLKREDTIGTFCVIGGVLLVISLIIYFCV